jgi:hypothetical protein
MGFRLSRVYALRFEGALEGLEVDIKATSVGTVLEMRGAENDRAMAELLAAHILRWNYENEAGEPLEPTVDNLLALEAVVFARIVREWHRAASGVTSPLDPPSTDGEQSQEQSIPMETL